MVCCLSAPVFACTDPFVDSASTYGVPSSARISLRSLTVRLSGTLSQITVLIGRRWRCSAETQIILINSTFESNSVSSLNPYFAGISLYTLLLIFFVDAFRTIGNAAGGAAGCFLLINITGGLFRNNSAINTGVAETFGGAVSAISLTAVDAVFESNAAVVISSSQAGTSIHTRYCCCCVPLPT